MHLVPLSCIYKVYRAINAQAIGSETHSVPIGIPLIAITGEHGNLTMLSYDDPSIFSFELIRCTKELPFLEIKDQSQDDPNDEKHIAFSTKMDTGKTGNWD